APITQAPPVADPFADTAEPSAEGSCLNGSGATLQPGRYCSGLRLSGAVKLEPGVYHVSGGDFRANANSVITGHGVTIYLDDGAAIRLNGNATLDLSAPVSGAYAGILFFGDRAATGSSTLNGTAHSRMTGAIYLPRQAVSYIGNFSGQDGCVQVV